MILASFFRATREIFDDTVAVASDRGSVTVTITVYTIAVTTE
jgi:hypothetical protein